MYGALAADSVAPHLRVLRWCGFCGLGGGGGGRAARLHALYRDATLALTLAYLLQETVYAYRVRADMGLLARVMYLLLCHVTSFVKQLVFRVRAARVDDLLARLNEPELRQAGEKPARLQRTAAAGARRFVLAYAGCAVLTCSLWAAFGALQFERTRRVELPFWVPYDYNRSHATFYPVLAYSYYVTTLVGIANTTMDAFMATVLQQCRTQLRILRMNFERLPQRAAELGAQPPRARDPLTRRLLECLQHYDRITELAQLLQDTFGSAILVQFGIGGWILCMAAYQLVHLRVLSIEFASTVLFMSCILTELFLYCYYGNELSDESARVLQSVYSMPWRRTPLRFQRALLVVLERAKRPLRPAAGLVVPLSLDTFVRIIKSSYTFYAVLRQTK